MSRENAMNYEENIKLLEAIIAALERGELPLEDALAQFEEGVALVRSTGELLDKAEQKVFKLLQGEDGELKVSPVES